MLDDLADRARDLYGVVLEDAGVLAPRSVARRAAAVSRLSSPHFRRRARRRPAHRPAFSLKLERALARAPIEIGSSTTRPPALAARVPRRGRHRASAPSGQSADQPGGSSEHSTPNLARSRSVSVLAGRPAEGHRTRRFGPGLRRLREAVRCLRQRLALNLPRRAFAWTVARDALLEPGGLVEARWKRSPPAECKRSERPAPARSRPLRVGPVGLREALRWLGDEVRPEQGARVPRSCLKPRRFAARGLSVALSRFRRRAAVRFAASTRPLPGRATAPVPDPSDRSAAHCRRTRSGSSSRPCRPAWPVGRAPAEAALLGAECGALHRLRSCASPADGRASDARRLQRRHAQRISASRIASGEEDADGCRWHDRTDPAHDAADEHPRLADAARVQRRALYPVPIRRRPAACEPAPVQGDETADANACLAR
jgi:hypothetical protein